VIFHGIDGDMTVLRRRKFLSPLVALHELFADTSKVDPRNEMEFC
jgi:hypothetical protein